MVEITPLFAAGNPLAALDRTGLESLFHGWRGASGRRYVCSVYGLDEPPVFDARRAVVAAVRRGVFGAAIAFVFQPGEHADAAAWALWAQKARQCGAVEFHVHLLAANAAERDCAMRDLAPAQRRAA